VVKTAHLLNFPHRLNVSRCHRSPGEEKTIFTRLT